MNQSNNRRRVFTIIICFIGLFVVVFVAQYFISLRSLVVNYENIDRVEIYKSSSLNRDSRGDVKPVKSLMQSGQKIKLQKGKYTLKYFGSEGYETKLQEIDVASKEGTEVSLSPSFSEEKLEQILEGEFGKISAVLIKKFPKIPELYEIQKGKLYENGKWYGTKLKHKNPADLNSDTLRVILQKNNGVWEVMTSPPDITFNKFSYPNIPTQLLSEVNSQ